LEKEEQKRDKEEEKNASLTFWQKPRSETTTRFSERTRERERE
jgi:hypothetical protein